MSVAYISCTFFLPGGDGNIGVAVRQPSGAIVHNYAWKPSAEYEEEHAIGGYYSVCLDNQFSRFSGKLVNLYMTTFKYDEWEKMAAEIEVRPSHKLLVYRFKRLASKRFKNQFDKSVYKILDCKKGWWKKRHYTESMKLDEKVG